MGKRRVMSVGVAGKLDILKRISENTGKMDLAIAEFWKVILNTKAHKEKIVLLNKIQMLSGDRADGTEIDKTPVGKQESTKYERYTKYEKQQKHQIYSHVTMYDTGKFFASLEAKGSSSEIYIISTDKKSEKLEDIWGEILGLNEHSRQLFVEYIYPFFVKFIKKWMLK